MTAPRLDRRFGAIPLDNGRTRFRLWAPDQQNVKLILESKPALPMIRRSGGWFETETVAPGGSRYAFQLDDGTAVPDPASRAQERDVHGFSLVIDPNDYKWRHPEWLGRPWAESVIYELHVGVLGGFKGVEAELLRLAELGITAIELMPVNEFPGARNWGYDGTLPFAPDYAYGRPHDLKALIDTAHGLGLNVLLDVVYNHFGPDGNYLGLYAKRFFRDDIHTPWGAAIDFQQEEVSRFFLENALQWLFEYRFDGLRFDAVHAIMEREWLREVAREIRKHTPTNRHISLVLENDNNDSELLERLYDAQWNDDGHHILHVLLTGEKEGYYADYADRREEKLLRALTEGFIYQGEWSEHRSRKRGSSTANLSPASFVLFLQNHDQIGNRALGERLQGWVRNDALEAATTLLLLCPQVPLIFMGEELAAESPFLFFTDHGDDLAEKVREGRRKEFSSFGAFDTASSIPDPNALSAFERSMPRPSPAAQARGELFRRLLEIRRTELTPRLNGVRPLGGKILGAGAIQARWRLADGSLWDLAINLGPAPVALEQAGRSVFRSGKKSLSGVLPIHTTTVAMAAP